jgi:hypothetical protein
VPCRERRGGLKAILDRIDQLAPAIKPGAGGPEVA